MKYYSEILLKNGRRCVLRNAEAADAQALRAVFRATHAETDYLLTYPEENNLTPEQEAQFILAKKGSPNEVEICAFVEGRMAGSAGIDAVGRLEKVRHRAEFGVSILREYWGQGIGRGLTEACIACARQAGYAQMELTVVAENGPAIRLYESVGFREFGRNPRGFRSRHTGWQETVLMRMEL